jgi:predicted RNA-binding protein with PUA-like domain
MNAPPAPVRRRGGCGFVLSFAPGSDVFHTMPKHWMVKSEPASYSWEQFHKEGRAAWTGVRNYQARINLRAMKVGDLVLFYHSVTGKEVVGIAKVAREAYPDPTADEPGWDCVDLVPAKPLKNPVTLATIKATPAFKEIALLRQSRLSVMPLDAEDYAAIVKLGTK